MPLRSRRAALCVAVTATALLAVTAAPAALAATPPAGLYGAADPTYDGVWRQSYALLALHTAGVTAPPAAVTWLSGQQCADGGFPSYRASTATACSPKTEDTNATGIAMQALVAVGGHGPAVTKATGWLKTVQNADGGWSYNPGGASDPDSTAVVMGGLQAAGGNDSLPAKAGRTPYDALRGFQFGCDAKAADRGSYGYPTDGKPVVNAKATTDAVRGARNAGFVVSAPESDTAPAAPACGGSADPYASLAPAAAAQAGAAWLVQQLTAGGGHLTAVTPGAAKATPDYGTTADAIVALAATGELKTARSAYTWLAANSASWSHGNPAALSQLILAAHATGNNPQGVGGTNYVKQLTNLGPAPAPAPAAASAKPTASAEHKKKDSSSSGSVWLIVAVFFVASVGVGFLLSGRKRRQG